MADSPTPKVRIPSGIRPGDVIAVKTLISHPMESGQRKDAAGKAIPRRIVNALRVTFHGREVFSAALEPAIAANPYVAFHVRVDGPGTLEFTWTDDDGSVYRASETVSFG